MSIKKILVGAAASAILLGNLAIPAFAADEQNGPNNNDSVVQAQDVTVQSGEEGTANDCDDVDDDLVECNELGF